MSAAQTRQDSHTAPPQLDLLLDGFVRASFDHTTEYALLKPIVEGRLPLEHWKIWGIQRYKAAAGFVGFLQSAFDKAQAGGLTRVAEVLRQNICDETGVSPVTGRILVAGPHDAWRKDFYAALDISEQELQDTPAESYTQDYAAALKSITEQGSAWRHISAIMNLEVSLPGEFAFILFGAERTPGLREKMAITPGCDIKAVRKARLYLEHHIFHDLKQHAPELWYAMWHDYQDCLQRDGYTTEAALVGMGDMSIARRDFYKGLYEQLSLQPAP